MDERRDVGEVDAWGITAGYHDIEGVWHATSDDTRHALRDAMGDPVSTPLRWFVEAGHEHPLWGAADLLLEDGSIVSSVTTLPRDLPWGWHQLQPGDGGPVTELVVHPATCPAPGRRAGIAVQVHELWGEGTWEAGDLTDLARLLERLVDAGGELALLSPLHALLPGPFQDPSPYSPSSRRWRHPLLARPPGPRPDVTRPDPLRLVERHRVWDAAQRALDEAFEHLDTESDDHARWRSWAHDQGADLQRFARWSVAAERFGPQWRHWPHDLRRPDGPGWDQWFLPGSEAQRRADRHAWAQWRVSAAWERCRSTGVGLITDLAVGFHPDGFDAWDLQDVTAQGVSLGAPPDPFATAGQNWGLPPLHPGRLAAQRFEPWLATLRAAADGAAGVRLDHVMGLFRQFWIPAGGDPADGAYVRFPGHELMALLAREARRYQVFVVGEDLGTVEPSVRHLMARRGVLGTRVGWFEPDPSPATWSVESLATLTTHDLPTLASVWTSHDPDASEARGRLAGIAGVSAGQMLSPREVIDAAHAALLAAPCHVRLASVDDLCASTLRPNTPGRVGPPSWCVRLPMPVERIPLEVFHT